MLYSVLPSSGKSGSLRPRSVLPTFVIVVFLITTSIYHYIGQTISSIFRLPDARGSIIVGTQDLVVAPSAKLKPFAAWLSVVSLRVPLNSSSMGMYK